MTRYGSQPSVMRHFEFEQEQVRGTPFLNDTLFPPVRLPRRRFLAALDSLIYNTNF
jgi:hypothetical protein